MGERAAFELRRGTVPFVDTDHLIDPSGGEFVALGMEGDGVQTLRGFGESHDPLARLDAPQFHRLVRGSRDERLAVGAEGDGEHGPGVMLECVQLLACGNVPQDQQLVVAGGDEPVAGRTEGQRVDRIGVSGQDARLGAAELPDPHVSDDAGKPFSRSEVRRIGTERHGVDWVLCADESLLDAAARQAEKQYLAMPGGGQPLAVGAERDRRDAGGDGDFGLDVADAELGGRLRRLRRGGFGAQVDPALDEFDFFGPGLFRVFGRHFGLGRPEQHLDEPAVVAFARDDGRPRVAPFHQHLESEQAEAPFAVVVAVVTAQAVRFEEGGDLFFVRGSRGVIGAGGSARNDR